MSTKTPHHVTAFHSSRLEDPAQNGLGLMRLMLAMLVLITHGFIVGGYGPDPLEVFSGGTISLGVMAVHFFFVISGYLVSQSWDRLRSIPAYFLRRALRLLPGYWVCLVVTAVAFGPILWDLHFDSLSGYWDATPSPAEYVWRNFSLMQYQRTIGDFGAGALAPGYLNFSLWTLPYEFACYALLMLVASLGAIRKQSVWPLTFFAAAFLNYALDPTHSRFLGRVYAEAAVTRLPIYFTAGVVWWAWADRVRIGKAVWIAIAVVAMIATVLGRYHWVMPFCAAAIVFPLAAQFRSPRFLVKNDYSYGIYLYATPLERLLVALKLPFTGVWALCMLAAALALVFAMLSWHLCEKPALNSVRRA